MCENDNGSDEGEDVPVLVPETTCTASLLIARDVDWSMGLGVGLAKRSPEAMEASVDAAIELVYDVPVLFHFHIARTPEYTWYRAVVYLARLYRCSAYEAYQEIHDCSGVGQTVVWENPQGRPHKLTSQQLSSTHCVQHRPPHSQSSLFLTERERVVVVLWLILTHSSSY